MRSSFHRHYGEIIVSKKELLHQLAAASKHANLLLLLACGKTLPDYEVRLMRAALKFEFLGSLVYLTGRDQMGKPPLKKYVRFLFGDFYENTDDIRLELTRYMNAPISDELALSVFCKLVFIVSCCCPLLAETYEIRSEVVYRRLIEYAIDHACAGYSDVQRISQVIPQDVPVSGSVLAYLCGRLPGELSTALTEAGLPDSPIRW